MNAIKIGVSGFAWTREFYKRHLEILSLLLPRGITAFEVPMFSPAKLPVASIRRAMESNSLECTVCAILPEGINPISPDAEVRKKSIAHLIDCLNAAAEMGAKRIGGPVYAPIGYLPGHRRNREEWKHAIEAFQSITATLEANEQQLSIEPVNRSETFFLTTTADAVDLCEAINHPRIGVMIDTFHANIDEKNIARAVHTAGKRLKHIHASDNDRGLLGSGHVYFPAIVRALREIDYSGYLMIEGFGYSPSEPDSPGALWADMGVPPEEIAFAGAQYLSGLLANAAST